MRVSASTDFPHSLTYGYTCEMGEKEGSLVLLMLIYTFFVWGSSHFLKDLCVTLNESLRGRPIEDISYIHNMYT